MITQSDVCTLVTRVVSSTINRRDFDEAVRVASMHANFKSHTCQDVDFWFHYSLALRLAGYYANADKAQWHAQQCPGYDEIIEGDFLRDIALMHLRNGNPTKAQDMLRHVETNQHKDADENRRILLGALMGRVFAAFAAKASDDGRRRMLTRRAWRYYCEAEIAWLNMEDGQANQQWVNNNLFHWLRLEASLGNVAYLGDDTYSQYYSKFMSNERSIKRRTAARLMWRLGPLGVRIADRLG